MLSFKIHLYSILALLVTLLSGLACHAQDKGNQQDSRTIDRSVKVTRGQLPDLPFGITSFGAGAEGGWLYTFGGNVGEAHHYSKASQNGKIMGVQLDTENAQWKEIGEGPRMQGVAMIAHGGKLYRMGGLTATNSAEEDQHLISVDDFASFDLKTRTWTELPSLPEARSSHDAVVLGDTIYMIGGWTIEGDENTWLDTAWSIDLSQAELSWKSLPSPPFKRRALSVAVHGDKIYAIGGMQDRGGPTRSVSFFDPARNSWEVGPELPPSDKGAITGFGTSAFVADGRIYVSTSTGPVVSLNDDESEWIRLAELNVPRLFPRLIAIGNDKLVVLGGAGMGSGKELSVELIEIESTDKPKTKSPQSGTKEVSSVNHGNWPGFLGAGADPVAADSIPVEWSKEKNLAWKFSHPGYGQSSPVIWEDRVFFTSVEGEMKNSFHIYCVDLVTGKQLWKQSIDSKQSVKSSTYVSRAAPTPVVDKDRLITMFENGDLVAWTHDGERLWKRSLVDDYGPIDNGHCIAASPMQTEDAVYVLVDHNGPGYLLKVDKQDGETAWKADRSSRMSWNSPALITVGNKSCILVSASGTVDGYDLATGDVIFSDTNIAGNTAATPIPFGEGQFLVGASAGRDASKAVTNLAMQVTKTADGKLALQKSWDAGRASCTFGSPIVYKGFAYWVGKGGILFCLDANSGEMQYKQRIGDSAWATPWGIGDRIYFFGKEGNTVVVSTGPEFKKIATNSFEPEIEATTVANNGTSKSTTPEPQVTYGVAAVTGSLLIRTGNTVYCVRKD